MDLWVEPPTKAAPKWTITPWLGQECGFFVPSDSENNLRQMEWTPVEFGASVISHFRMPKDNALKVFVTAPYAGRIPQMGSAVFGRDGTLLGIIAEVEMYKFRCWPAGGGEDVAWVPQVHEAEAEAWCRRLSDFRQASIRRYMGLFLGMEPSSGTQIG